MGSSSRYVVFLVALLLSLVFSLSPAWAADVGGTIVPRFNHALPNVPGKSLIAVEVDYPPGGKTPAHHHAASAFIMGYVLSGAIRSQVAGQPVQVYHAGQTFYENPGADHLVSENASVTEPAKLLAVFVVDSKHGTLTTLDKSAHP